MASEPTPAWCHRGHPGAVGRDGGSSAYQGDEVGERELEADVDDVLLPPGRAQVPVVVGHQVIEQLFLLVSAQDT